MGSVVLAEEYVYVRLQQNHVTSRNAAAVWIWYPAVLTRLSLRCLSNLPCLVTNRASQLPARRRRYRSLQDETQPKRICKAAGLLSSLAARRHYTMYVPADADVRVLLMDLKVDPEGAGCKNAADRFKLLQKALLKTQHLKHILKKAGDSSQAFDPSTLKKINSRGKLVETEFDVEKMYGMQECMAVQIQSPEIFTAWFELRRTLCSWIEKHIQGGVIRVQLDDSRDPECGMGGVIDLLGARVTPDGKVPILETRHCFYYPKEVSVGAAAAMNSKVAPGLMLNIMMTVEPEEMKLLAVLFDTNASRLAPSYVAVQQEEWGTGTHLTPSFLLPIEPLTEEVTLPKQCHVCGKEGAKSCGACRTVAYCGKECQNQDWKAHKKACKEVQAAAAAANSTSVIIDLTAVGPEAPFMSHIPVNASSSAARRPPMRNMSKEINGAAGVNPDPAKRFVVKVQAPIGDPGGSLYMYDQKRKVQAFIKSSQQPAYSQLVKVIRASGYMGAKLYCWAALDTSEQLRVFTEPLPSQTQSW